MANMLRATLQQIVVRQMPMPRPMVDVRPQIARAYREGWYDAWEAVYLQLKDLLKDFPEDLDSPPDDMI